MQLEGLLPGREACSNERLTTSPGKSEGIASQLEIIDPDILGMTHSGLFEIALIFEPCAGNISPRHACSVLAGEGVGKEGVAR